MKKCLLGLIILAVYSPVFADDLFLQAGTGFAKSLDEEVMGLRYQRDTSRLFDHVSFYEAVYLYWTNSCRAQGLGFARSIGWKVAESGSFSMSAGGMGVSRRTEHMGTSLQFYFRFAYSVKPDGRKISVDVVHMSNGKSFFGWNGHNSGENFLTVSVGLF